MSPRPAETYRGYRRNEARGRPHTAPTRPGRIKIAKGQTPVSPIAGMPLARITRDVATQGYGYKRWKLQALNAAIARYNEAARRVARRRDVEFTPRKSIHPTKKGPGRGTW